MHKLWTYENTFFQNNEHNENQAPGSFAQTVPEKTGLIKSVLISQTKAMNKLWKVIDDQLTFMELNNLSFEEFFLKKVSDWY